MNEGIIHQWIYVIIPIEFDKKTPEGNLTRPVFCAFCKACRKYFTEVIPIEREGKISDSSLPRYGCTPISDDVRLI